jgi:hypothetical protein
MQEIVSFCDHHVERDGSRVLGKGMRIGIAGQWKRLDLCDECTRELLGPLETVLQAHGRAVADETPELLEPKKRVSPSYTDEAYVRRLESMKTARQCLWCPQVIAGGYQVLKQHIGAVHGLDTFEAAYGDTCPICRQSGIARLSGHVGRGHMVKLADAFEWAFWGGDPIARAIADDRRALGFGVGEPAQTDGTLEMVAAARKAWVDAHGAA